MFVIHKEVGQNVNVINRLEKLGLSYSVIFTESANHMGIYTPVIEYLGVPLDEHHAEKLLDDMYGKEDGNDGN